jgi:hypothetical protein
VDTDSLSACPLLDDEELDDPEESVMFVERRWGVFLFQSTSCNVGAIRDQSTSARADSQTETRTEEEGKEARVSELTFQ